MSTKMKNFLLNLDYMSPLPELRIFNKVRYTNSLGTLLSILISALIISLSGYFAYQTFSREKATISVIEQVNIKTSTNITENPFVFFAYSTGGKHVCDPEKYIYF